MPKASTPLNHLIKHRTGHIREPYTLLEIVRKIESNDYGAEMMLQHLLLWVAINEKGKRRNSN